jgi:hypothetical protein
MVTVSAHLRRGPGELEPETSPPESPSYSAVVEVSERERRGEVTKKSEKTINWGPLASALSTLRSSLGQLSSQCDRMSGCGAWHFS